MVIKRALSETAYGYYSVIRSLDNIERRLQADGLDVQKYQRELLQLLNENIKEFEKMLDTIEPLPELLEPINVVIGRLHRIKTVLE